MALAPTRQTTLRAAYARWALDAQPLCVRAAYHRHPPHGYPFLLPPPPPSPCAISWISPRFAHPTHSYPYPLPSLLPSFQLVLSIALLVVFSPPLPLRLLLPTLSLFPPPLALSAGSLQSRYSFSSHHSSPYLPPRPSPRAVSWFSPPRSTPCALCSSPSTCCSCASPTPR